MDGELGTERLHRLRCEECDVESDLRAIRWEAHLAVEDDGTTSVACFCPECIGEFEQG